jgi:hypothetical protein
LVGRFPPPLFRLAEAWRKKKSSTFVVGRDGGTPRKLTDQEKEKVPPADGRWDNAHQRVLFVDDGDVVMV